MNRALFLDRDGTLNIDYGYIRNPQQVQLIPGVAEALKTLQDDYGFIFIVVSNQSGIARGILTEDELLAVNEKINMMLLDSGVRILKFYWCPHHPEYGEMNDCGCRKPSPGMITKAIKKFNINPSWSYMVGDKLSDAEAGYNAGIKSILLASKDFSGENTFSGLQNPHLFPNFVAYNFSEVCDFIIKDFNDSSR